MGEGREGGQDHHLLKWTVYAKETHEEKLTWIKGQSLRQTSITMFTERVRLTSPCSNVHFAESCHGRGFSRHYRDAAWKQDMHQKKQ